MNEAQFEAAIQDAQRELSASVQDCMAENPDVGEDDIAHDVAQSIACGLPYAVAKEFLRREGVAEPTHLFAQRADVVTAAFVEATRPAHYEERRRRNDRSRNKAGHHTEPWSNDELEVLLMWSGDEDELVVVAELLGRTIEACRQMYYVTVRGVVRAHRSKNRPLEVRHATCPYCHLEHPGEC